MTDTIKPEVERYDPIEYYAMGGSGTGQMKRDPDGDWVEFEEYQKLRSDLAAARQRIEVLEGGLEAELREHRNWAHSEDCHCSDSDDMHDPDCTCGKTKAVARIEAALAPEPTPEQPAAATDKELLDWMETQVCWIGIHGEFETKARIYAGKGYKETVREAVRNAIAQEAQPAAERSAQ